MPPPIDYTKTFFDFWKAQGEVFVQAQEQAGRALADGMQALAEGKLPAFPASGGGELGQANQAMQDLWSAAGSLSAALAAKIPSAQGNETVETTFRHMLDPHSWLAAGGEMDEVLGRMSEGPRFADLWDMERRYARVMHAWATMRQRSLEHNAVVLQAWMRAGATFARQLADRNKSEQASADSRAMLAMWTEIANAELVETQRSEPFLASQSAMIRASTELRMAQQDLVERAGKQYGFPTRTELDDVHRSVTELRREVRELRRMARSEPQAPKAAAVAPQAAKDAARPPAARRRNVAQTAAPQTATPRTAGAKA